MKRSAGRMAVVMLFMLVMLLGLCSSCNSDHGVKGTYMDASGAWVLELKSGGDATLTFYGDSRPCTYSVSGDQITLSCKGEREKLNFNVHQDGSLTAQGFMPALRKSK